MPSGALDRIGGLLTRWRCRHTCALVAACLLLSAGVGVAGAQATRYASAPPLLLGAAWYPEQWDEAVWDADLAKMEAAHIHLVRVGEFAWSTMEPAEGRYDFAWLDRAIAKAAAHHIVVVLGTPTAAPPAWLTSKYPETLRMDADGRRDEHGNRQQFSFASAKYRELAHGIAEKMAERYGHNPDVVGWQLDNEYANDSFDPEARAQFHLWLKRKYGSIDTLNTLWTTRYWSQTYDNFDEIPVRAREENPALLLDWRRFVSDTWKSYSENQISAIRPHADPRQFITTNTMGWFDGFDSYTVHQVLDIAAWDDYISDPVYDPADNGARHDLTRGFKQKNFWVMETEPAFVNWRKTNNPLEKGQVRDMAWQAVGHGADAVEYWQWRAALNGQEQYHGTLVGTDGEPVPVYAEVQQVGLEFEKAGPALAGTVPVSNVALLEDYDSRWAIDFQRHAAAFDPVAELVSFYRPLRAQAQGVDILPPSADLGTGAGRYKLVVAPALNVLTQAQADHLLAYVNAGGHLVLGPRSGMKNEYDATWQQRQPGPLQTAAGLEVEEYYALDGPVPVTGDAGTGTAQVWAEILRPSDSDTHVLARYGKSNGWLDGRPAITTRAVGKGSITYIGFWPDAAMLDRVTARLLKNAEVKPLLADTPQGVEVCERMGEGRRVWVLINHTTAPQHVPLPSAMKSLLRGSSGTAVELEPYGVDVLQQ